MKIVTVNVLHYHTADEIMPEGMVKKFKLEDGEVVVKEEIQMQVGGTVILLISPQKEETIAEAVYRIVEERILGVDTEFEIEIVSELDVSEETVIFQQGI